MTKTQKEIRKIVVDFIGHHPDIIQIILELIERFPELNPAVTGIIKVYLRFIRCFDSGNKLFICGNGGSFADRLVR